MLHADLPVGQPWVPDDPTAGPSLSVGRYVARGSRQMRATMLRQLLNLGFWAALSETYPRSRAVDGSGWPALKTRAADRRRSCGTSCSSLDSSAASTVTPSGESGEANRAAAWSASCWRSVGL